jgi:RNA-directed DNA polymerase
MIATKPYDYTVDEVRAAYRLVKAKRGAAGIDRQTLQAFECNIKGNIYKIYNRLASGSYFPPPVKAVAIPKKSGGKRLLGVPTVSDRVAQTVIKRRLEAVLEPVFHWDSYGYRPHKSAHQALKVTRKRCWSYDYVVEFDIAKFFDCLDHQLLMKALRHHKVEKSILLYVERWLTAPLKFGDGKIERRTRGTPQGGVISPLLANLFLHYVFDTWMQRTFPTLPFCRYADDAIVHCRNLGEAERVLAALTSRLEECGLTIHPDKTQIVCCKVGQPRARNVGFQFGFLGYTFRPRVCRGRENEKIFAGFVPAISSTAEGSIRGAMRQLPFNSLKSLSLQAIATHSQPYLQGWINYYCLFYKTRFSRVASYFNSLLVRWAIRKFKRFRGHKGRARAWLDVIAKDDPNLFPHWRYGWTRMVAE